MNSITVIMLMTGSGRVFISGFEEAIVLTGKEKRSIRPITLSVDPDKSACPMCRIAPRNFKHVIKRHMGFQMRGQFIENQINFSLIGHRARKGGAAGQVAHKMSAEAVRGEQAVQITAAKVLLVNLGSKPCEIRGSEIRGILHSPLIMR